MFHLMQPLVGGYFSTAAQRKKAREKRAAAKKAKEEAAKKQQEPPPAKPAEPKPVSTDVVDEKEAWFNELLHDLYYNEKLMRGRDVLFHRIKQDYPEVNKEGLSRRYIADWLEKQEVHSVFKAGPALAKQRSIQRIVSKAPFNRWCMDLVDFGTKESDGMKWVLNVVDTFSKYAWSRAMPNKDGETVVKHLTEILNEAKTKFGDNAKPHVIQSDNGSEFISGKMDKLLKDRGIKQIFSLPHKPQSNGAVERFNGTMERMINQIRYQDGDTHWPKYLAKVIANYNDSYQDSIKTTPMSVMEKYTKGEDLKPTFDQLEKRRLTMNPSLGKPDAKLYQVGEKVRMRLDLDKRAGRNWSRDFFTIVKVSKSKYGPQYSRTLYKLQAKNGEVLPNVYQNDQLAPYVEPTNKMAENVPQHIVQRLIEPVIAEFHTDDGTLQKMQAYVVKFVGEKDWQHVRRDTLLEDVPKLIKNFEVAHNVEWDGLNKPKWVKPKKKKK